MTTITRATPAVAVSSRPGAGAALRHTATLAWRSLVQIKHNPMELIDLSVQPIMFRSSPDSARRSAAYALIVSSMR